MEWIITPVILIVLVLLIILLKPKDVGGAYDPYFVQINSALKKAGIGTARIFIDLDRLDRNIATIQANIPSDSHYRIVVKSIPCCGFDSYDQGQKSTQINSCWFIALLSR